MLGGYLGLLEMASLGIVGANPIVQTPKGHTVVPVYKGVDRTHSVEIPRGECQKFF